MVDSNFVVEAEQLARIAILSEAICTLAWQADPEGEQDETRLKEQRARDAFAALMQHIRTYADPSPQPLPREAMPEGGEEAAGTSGVGEAQPQQDAMRSGFMFGWKAAAVWAHREDLIADIGSPAYEKDCDAACGVMVGEHEPWVPYLSDRADGVRGHYAICRWNPRGYREAWNLRSHSWASCSDEVLTLEQAQKLLAGLTLPSGVAIPVAPSREHAELMLLAAHDLESWMKSYHHDAATESTVQKLKAAALGVKGLDRG